MIPGEGLEIPLDSKVTSKKRLTIKESAEMVYDLSNKSIPINNLKIEFREDDLFDEQYEVSNWAGLKTRGKGKEKKLAELDELEDRVEPGQELEFKGKRYSSDYIRAC